MASIKKYQSSVIGILKHNEREFQECTTNEEIDFSRTEENYSLITRGNTVHEIEQYRKETMKEVFHLDRKNIVLCNEVVCTLPTDCPPEQEHQFFEESLKYIISTIPMGERAILQAVVHKDEGHIEKNGQTIVNGYAHMHVVYIPAVEDTKHDNYDYKLCSDQLTKRSVLKQWHPNYQKWLDDAGVQATVHNGKTNGKGISVKALKEITKETGLTLDEIKNLDKEKRHLQEVVNEQAKQIEELKREHEHQWGSTWGEVEHTW